MSSKKIEKQFDLLRIVVAISISLIIAFVLILLVSKTPIESLSQFLAGPFTSLRRMGNVIEMSIPLLFTGVGVSIMYSGGQTNMAAEGAFFMGGVGASIMATQIFLPMGLHPLVCILIGGVFGALVCFIPAILYVRWGAKPVVSSLMVNYIALYFGLYIINYVIRDADVGYMASLAYTSTAIIPRIIEGTKIHAGLFLAIIVVVGGYFFLIKSKRGYAIRMVGQNPDFARYSGIKVASVILSCQLLGGFLSGIGGATEVLGMYNRFQYQSLTGHGFDGILVAIIARYNPKIVPVAALFLAYVRVGADVMYRMTDVPVEIVSIIQAVIIMLVAAERFLYHLKHKKIVQNSQKQMAAGEV